MLRTTDAIDGDAASARPPSLVCADSGVAAAPTHRIRIVVFHMDGASRLE
jgi:hypothetical protein